MTPEHTPITLGKDSTNIQNYVSLKPSIECISFENRTVKFLDYIVTDSTHVSYYTLINTFIFQLIDLLAHNTLFNPILCPD